ncbi:MAG: hypothetical protein WB699_13145 [Bacteroidota bacterium]
MKFKDLWIKAPADDKASEESTNAPQSSNPSPSSQSAYGATPGSTREGDSAIFVQQLDAALEKANLPSQQDYLDFAKALKNMESLPMDEATRYKAAYATLQSVGCDLRQLIDSFDYYEGILDGEKDKFDEALRSTVTESVMQKEKQIKQLTGENDDHSAEIQKLTAAINLNQQSITKLQGELADINARLDQRKSGFMAAYNSLKQRLQGDEGKIKTYLSQELAAQPAISNKKKT